MCQRSQVALSLSFYRLGATLLVLLVYCAQAPAADPSVLSGGERETLRRYARATWKSFEAMALPGGLPADGLCRGADGAWTPTRQTSPTDIAAYLWSTLAAEKLQLIESSEAGRRLDRTMAALARLERSHGFFFDRFDADTEATSKRPAAREKPSRPLVSVVDNGWLAAALIMASATMPTHRSRADELLKPMDFGFFYEAYDPADPVRHPGQLRGVYWPDDNSFGTLYGIVNTEPRIASYIGIARGQLPAEHYYRMNRTWRPEQRGRAQEQTPRGESRTYVGVDVFEGHYTYRGMRIVPSWGGSMFEALMVPLFVPEAQWAPRSWGVNHPLYVRAQIEYGLDEARYGFWGFSPACRPTGGYRTYGVDAIGVDPNGYTSTDDELPAVGGSRQRASAGGVVTPHASFLALRFAPHEAMANLQALAGRFPIYGPYGFHDSVNVSSGVVSDCVLALDQGMIMAAIANALADDAMRHAFADGAIETAIRPLIAQEEFTAGAPGAIDSGHGGSAQNKSRSSPRSSH
jgi:Putative glucoamylase/Protein of unknown function (DUF3131)